MKPDGRVFCDVMIDVDERCNDPVAAGRNKCHRHLTGERPSWLKKGQAVRDRYRELRFGVVGDDHADLVGHVFVEWVDGSKSHAGVNHWRENLQPVDVAGMCGAPPAGLAPTDAAAASVKDTNPKDAVGTGKVPMSVLPQQPLALFGLAMMEGARKYGRHNYRAAGIRYSVYFDALMRHMAAWWEGEDIDPDSGLPHPAKAGACLVILLDAMLQQNGTDDRPPKSPPGWLAELNARAAELLVKYPAPLPPHVEKK